MSLVRTAGVAGSFVLVVALGPKAWAADAGVMDGGAVDAGGADAGGCEAGSGLACEQCDVSGFTPTTMAPPINPSPMVCADADISSFVTNCVDTATATSATCAAWQSSTSPSCVSCVLTPDTSAQWGAAVCNTTSCSFNVAGCIDITLGQVSIEKNMGGSGSCGDLVNASYGCQDYACGTCSTTTTDFTNCANSAIMNECSTYANGVTSTTGPCNAIDGSASETSCFLQGGDSDVQALVTLFCGGAVTPPPDAGTDSGTISMDAGKADSGAPKDAGVDAKAGSDGGLEDGGTGSSLKTGCHCDAAGGGAGSSTLVLLGFAGALGLAASRRKRRA